MENLIPIFNQINELGITIHIVKVPAHSDMKYNEIADIKAKEAAQLAEQLHIENNYNWNPLKAPAIVDIQKWITELNNKYQINNQNEFNKIKNELTYNFNETDFIIDNNFINSLYYNENQLRKNIHMCLVHYIL
jgi:hypothetical protein